MNYKIVAVLCDMDDLSLYKVPIELYKEMISFLGDVRFPKFQKIYDALCEDDVDPKIQELYERLYQCEIIECDLIQEY